MNQNQKQKQIAEENVVKPDIVFDFESMSEGEKLFVEQALVSDSIIEAVVSRLVINEDTPLFHASITGVLKRQAQDTIILSIWKHINDDQLDHLNGYINSVTVTDPKLGKDALLIEFALMYPELMVKVYDDLSVFFEEFIERHNRFQD